MQFRPYPLLTVFSVVSVVILTLFGNWQYARYQDKLALKRVTPAWETLSGTVIPASARLVYAFDDGKAGWREVVAVDTGDDVIYTPLKVHFEVDPPKVDLALLIAAPEAFSARGTFHPPYRRNAFTAVDDPENGLFYTFDTSALARSLSPADAARVRADVFEPETLVAVEAGRTRPYTNPFARPEALDRLPPERHFGYALTWWGLAIALVGVYLALHHQRGRLQFRRKDGP